MGLTCIFAEGYGSNGLPLSRNQNLLEWVCKPKCGHLILNAAKLCNNFIEKGDEDLNRVAAWLQRSNQMNTSYDCHAGMKPCNKKLLNNSEQIIIGKARSRSKPEARSNSSNSQNTELISNIDTSTTTAQIYPDVAMNSDQSGFA